MIFTVTSLFFSCGSDGKSSNSSTPLTSATYSGADPKGDFIAIEIDGSAQTVTHNNYTTSETNGPYTYSTVTDPTLSGGFTNMFMTEVFNTNMYALFVIVDGVAIIYQLFTNNGTASDFTDDSPYETPGYAFVRLDMDDLSSFKEKSFNWIKFKMDTTNTEGNFEAGFAAFDSGIGTAYGAYYNNRADEADGSPPYGDYDANGIDDIGPLNLDSFTHDASTMSHSSGNLTFIPNKNGDSVLDFGANEGAGYAVRQADTKEWQSAYNGTYFMMVYHNDSTGAEQSVEPMKLVLSTSTSNSTNGYFRAYDHGSSTVTMEGEFIPVEDLTGANSPGGTTPIIDQFASTSGIGGATSTEIADANKAHGGFVSQPDSDTVLFGMMDPNGNYLFFTMFMDEGATYEYNFGFGVK
jgi:hypothetical protein